MLHMGVNPIQVHLLKHYNSAYTLNLELRKGTSKTAFAYCQCSDQKLFLLSPSLRWRHGPCELDVASISALNEASHGQDPRCRWDISHLFTGKESACFSSTWTDRTYDATNVPFHHAEQQWPGPEEGRRQHWRRATSELV